MRYELESLSDARSNWDQRISAYESTQLFHRQAWLDYLAASRGVSIERWGIRDHGRLVGYFCGGIFSKGPFRILGSPLKGWGTNFMGPIVNSDFSAEAFLRAVDDLAAAENISAIELANPVLPKSHMESYGYHYKAQPTYVVAITPYDEAPVLNRIDKKDRSTMRKGKRMGLQVAEATDASIVDQYYEQFLAVMLRKGMFPSYGRECPRMLWDHVHPSGILLALKVIDPDGNTVATGLFPHDNKTIYFWGGASRAEARRYSPNDLLQWSVIEWAIQHGLSAYDVSGDGMFNRKFGGQFQEQQRWTKFYSRIARWGQFTYAKYHATRMKLTSRLIRTSHKYCVRHA